MEMAEKIPGWIERLLLPRLSSLEGDIKEFRGEARGELKSIHTRLDSVEKEVRAELKAINARLDAVEKGLNARLDLVEKGLTARLSSVENGLNARLDAVEKGLEDLKSRMTLIQDVAMLKAEVKELKQSLQRR